MEPRRKPDSDRDDVIREVVDEWSEVEFVATGTAVDGYDGLTGDATNYQLGDDGVLEVCVDGETALRVTRGSEE